MMDVARKRTVFLIGIAIVILAACAPSRPIEATAALTVTGTPLPPPQAIDLGTFGKGAVSDVAWSPDGNLLAVRSSTGIHLHNTQTWEVVKTIPDSELEDRSLGYFAFSPDGKYLVFIAWGWNTPVAFWHYDLQSGEFSLLFEQLSLDPRSAPVFSPDGDSFAILNNVCENAGTEQQTCSYVLELRDSIDGKLLYPLHKYNAGSIFVFSPAGKQIAAASEDNFVRVWDTASGKMLYEFQHDSDVLDVAYSPDGRVLASASNDATMRFWDTQTGKNLAILSGFTQGIQRVAYLDQGKKLLVGEISTNRFQTYALNDQFLPADPLGNEMMLGERRDPSPRMDSDLKTFISPDTRKIAVLLNDTVQIWDLEKGKSILTLPEYHSRIFTWAFSPDSNMLAIADHNIHLWDVPSKKWLTVLPINAYEIQDVAFSPDGKQLVVSAAGDLTFWDTSTFQKIHEVKTEHGIDTLAYAPDGKQLVIAGNAHVQILDAETGSSQQEFAVEDDDRPLALRFSDDGKQLYYAGSIERLGWDLESGKTLYSFQTKPNRYDQAAITSDLALIWDWDSYRGFDPASTPQWNNSLQFFDPASGQALYNFANPDDQQYIAADLSFDGRLLAWYRNERIDLLDAASGQTLAAVDFREAGHLSLSPNARILVAQSYLNPIHLWDISSVSQRVEETIPLTATPAPPILSLPSATPTVPPLAIQPLSPSKKVNADAINPENVAQLEKLNELGLGRIHTVSWSPDGKRFALGGYPSVYIFDLNSSKPLVTLPAQGEVMKLAYSPDGKMLAGQISNASIEVWDVAAGQSLYKTDDIFCWNADMHFSADGQVLSAQCGWTIYRWNARDGSLIDKKEDRSRPNGVISTDGNFLLEGGGTTARIVDAKTEKIIRSAEVPEMTPNLGRFSPDGKTLLIWFYEYEIAPSGVLVPGKDFKSTIQLWNVERGQMPTLRASLPTGEWHHWEGDMMGDYQVLSFTADSHRLATSSGDGNIQVWSVESGKLLYTLPGGGEVSFSPNGNQLISIGDSVKIWDATPGKQPVERWKVSGLYEFQHLLALTKDGLVTADDGTFRFRSMNGNTITEQPVVIKAPDEDMSISAVSPDGKWLTYRTATKLILGKKVSQNVNWQTLEKFSDKPLVWDTQGVDFSPDSSMLAFIDSDRKVFLWRLDDLESKPLELSREIYFADLIFSPDSKLLLGVYGSSMEEQPLFLWDTATGKLLRTWKTKGYKFAFHPSGETLAFTEYDSGKIFLYDLSTWNLLLEMQGQKYVRKIAFSPDGSLLVTSGEKGTEFWNASTGKLLRTIEGSSPWQLIFSPDGKLLVVTVGDGRVQVWRVRLPAGKPRKNGKRGNPGWVWPESNSDLRLQNSGAGRA